MDWILQIPRALAETVADSRILLLLACGWLGYIYWLERKRSDRLEEAVGSIDRSNAAVLTYMQHDAIDKNRIENRLDRIEQNQARYLIPRKAQGEEGEKS